MRVRSPSRFADDLIHSGTTAIFPKPWTPQRRKLWRQCSDADTGLHRKIPLGGALAAGERDNGRQGCSGSLVRLAGKA